MKVSGRTAPLCLRWKQQGLEPLIRQRTGLLADPYFSASKIVWLLEQHQAGALARAGALAFGTVLFAEPLTLAKAAAVALIVGGIALLRMS